ncbi:MULTISPECIES: histidine phosphatase family protein [unclassified Rhodococcus (in: high G+C Gram-positive bacteria)]|uniref:SixA phosphatase family protein n=1 Tax=unclassified Rhodococcus (in: high G+C Gram-positive bacteria) TaxID=192944 RepID=UPI00163A0AA6|nr:MULTISPECIES: histidine phosphatase family protein [unclassified Rhodococcus (in: high G+C Gram-positive bacteria)]MBC2639323.1 histidine phosphatase family protein [Rhodococcus sp. 3A]MBC2895932.1 histidine phosphatase family protein [Rhodococcus sp. 4CII]
MASHSSSRTRTLILMRHGKSAYPEGVSDHERPLAPRGRKQAGLAGDWLRSTQPPIDAVLCSTARRTRETLEATRVGAPTRFAAELYGGYPPEILLEIAQVEPSVRTLLVVGHVPGMPSTALDLAGNPDTGDANQMREKFPTSALAVLAVPCEWNELTSSAASLATFHVPR